MIKIYRIKSLIMKEFLTLFRDPRGRLILIVPPILQLVVFAFAVTLEVKNISIAIYNQDNGKHSDKIIQKLIGSNYFNNFIFLKKNEDIKTSIDEQKALLALNFPSNFSKKIESNNQAKLQLILDGRRSNASQIVNSYIQNIVEIYKYEILQKKSQKPVEIIIENRNLFNENLIYLWSTVPSLVAILSMLITVSVTSLSIARERELGTFHQLIISPLTPLEIILGKTIPAIVIGILEGLLIWFIGVFVFGIPFLGSFILLFFSILIFVISVVGIGLFISSISKTQQQAILGAFIFMVPAVSLSGYASPIENMPEWLQKLTFLNPLKYFLIIVKGLFLKNLPLKDVLINVQPLIMIGIVTLSFAYWFSKKKVF